MPSRACGEIFEVDDRIGLGYYTCGKISNYHTSTSTISIDRRSRFCGFHVGQDTKLQCSAVLDRTKRASTSYLLHFMRVCITRSAAVVFLLGQRPRSSK